MATTTTNTKSMWAIVQDDSILGVYTSRSQARSYRGMIGGTVRRALVSIV